MRSHSRGALRLALVLAVAVVAIALPVGAGSDPEAAPAAAGRPNVVLLLTDDMRADDLRFLPKVRRLLVEHGTTFTNAISPHPLCCPARAELLTGQYGQNNGVRHNTGPWGGHRRLRDPDQNLGRWLRQAGYRTSYHGKFLNGYETGRPWRPAGWTKWDAQVGGIYAYWRAEFFDGDRYRGRYITDVMRERTHRVLGRFHRSGRPFFTFVNHVAPHVAVDGNELPRYERRYADAYADLVPPSFSDPAFDERRVRDLPPAYRFHKVDRHLIATLFRARVRALRSVDDAVAATVRRLRRLGELDDTYLVFTSDNGVGLGEHRLDHKNLLLDEALDVPLVVRGPGVPEGAEIEEPVSLVDLPATVVDWADARAGRPLDGLSLAPLLGGTGSWERDTILVQNGDERADETPGWSYRGVTTDRYLFAYRAGHPRLGVLFDRETDPHALRNRYRSPAYGAVRRELAARTRALTGCEGETCNRRFGRVPGPS